MQLPPTTHESDAALPSPRYANYVLTVMVVMYTCNYLDRYVLAVMIEAIKTDLVISDAVAGFMLGPAFAIFYTGLGIPIARWADVGSRRSIIALGMAVWSGFTALSGACLLYTSPSPRDQRGSRMPSSA